jgi:hypothetical protein
MPKSSVMRLRLQSRLGQEIAHPGAIFPWLQQLIFGGGAAVEKKLKSAYTT